MDSPPELKELNLGKEDNIMKKKVKRVVTVGDDWRVTGGFPYCCGVDVVGDFCVAEADEGVDDNTLAEVVSDSKVGLIVATTIPEQKEAIAELRRLKFRELVTFTGPTTRNRITLWGKVKRPRKAAQRAIKQAKG
jgi:hypothetical protein